MKTLTALSLVFAVAAAAQQPYIETFEVRLHNLDVVVTDAQGKAVRGLTKDDFLILEEGRPQEITNFSTYDLTSTTAAVPSSGAVAAKPGSVESESAPPRRFVFFVDDMALHKRVRQKLIENARQLVRSMRPGDVAAVIRPTGDKRLAQDYTGDKALVEKKLTEAIESCTLRINGPGVGAVQTLERGFNNARGDIGGSGMNRKMAQREYVQSTRDHIEQRLGQLRALIGSLAGVEGRKVLVILTPGLSAQPGREVYDLFEQIGMGEDRGNPIWGKIADLTPQIDDLARAAASRGVTIYALEPEIPLGMGMRRTAASRVNATTVANSHASVQDSLPADMMSELLTHRATTLASLTGKTGGTWFRGDAHIDDVFRQVTDDLSFYYSLAYRAGGERDNPRRVEVQVRNRPELRVRTRTEVLERSTEREMSDLVAASLIYPRNVNELGVTAIAGKARKEGKAILIPLEIVVPLSKLSFLGAADGKYVATFDLHYIAAGIDRDFAIGGKQQQKVELTAEQFANRATVNYRFKTAIEAVPGRVRIALGLLDPVSNLSSLQTLTASSK